jgi:hypothetical protein
MQEWVTDIRESVPESQSPIFLQAMGRCAEEESGKNFRRSHVGRDAEKLGESVNEKPQRRLSLRLMVYYGGDDSWASWLDPYLDQGNGNL